MQYRSSEQRIAWFSQQATTGSLVIQPPFQRRPVWTLKQKSNLIESVLLKLPIPEIYLTSEAAPDGSESYQVVDGQQRITSILEFLGVTSYEPFELAELDIGSSWEGITFQSLSDAEKSDFYSYPLAVRMLSDATTPDIADLFVRFNKYLTPLNPQELRHAVYSGPLAQLAEELANDPYWAENRIVDTKSIRRMKDIEFTSDLLIGIMHGPQSGNATTLDEYYQHYETDDAAMVLARAKRRFNRTLNLIQLLLPDIRETRWRNRSDFYSLALVLASRSSRRQLESSIDIVSDALKSFSDLIDDVRRSSSRQGPLTGPRIIVDYIEAIRRGSSDRTRRATRHTALGEFLDQALERPA